MHPEKKNTADQKPLPLISGTNYAIEDEADRILAAGRRGTTRYSEKTEYLSPEQLAFRKSKEVMNHHGVPDSRLFCGMYRRAYNPEAGQRPRNLRNHDEG
jgi:hypothetical protein